MASLVFLVYRARIQLAADAVGGQRLCNLRTHALVSPRGEVEVERAAIDGLCKPDQFGAVRPGFAVVFRQVRIEVHDLTLPLGYY